MQATHIALVDGTAARNIVLSNPRPYPQHLVLAYAQRNDVAPRPQTTRQHATANAHEDPIPLLVSLLAILLALAVSLCQSRAHARAVTQTLESANVQVVNVLPGDSIWGIASAHPIEGVTTQELVWWIRNANNLESPVLLPGQALKVPS